MLPGDDRPKAKWGGGSLRITPGPGRRISASSTLKDCKQYWQRIPLCCDLTHSQIFRKALRFVCSPPGTLMPDIRQVAPYKSPRDSCCGNILPSVCEAPCPESFASRLSRLKFPRPVGSTVRLAQPPAVSSTDCELHGFCWIFFWFPLPRQQWFGLAGCHGPPIDCCITQIHCICFLRTV